MAEDQALVRGTLAALLGPETDLEVGRGDEVLDAVARTLPIRRESAPAVPGAEGHGRRVFRRCQGAVPGGARTHPGLWFTAIPPVAQRAVP